MTFRRRSNWFAMAAAGYCLTSNAWGLPLVSYGHAQENDVFGSPVTQEPAPSQQPFQQDTPATIPGVGAGGLAVPPSDNVFIPTAPISQGISELSSDGDLLRSEEEMRRVEAQRVEAEVQNDLRETRLQLTRDPGAAIARLKSRQAEVRMAPGLDAGKRNQLLSLLSSALQTAARRDAESKANIAQAERALASANAAQRLIAEKDRRDASVQQLVQRFNALMDQHEFHEANSEVAPLVNELLRDTVISRSMEQKSAFASNYELLRDVVDRRRRAFVDSLYLNEAATIPFVDEPPVVYPSPETWAALTARRERFRSIDLAQTSSQSEQAIYESLKRKVQVQHKGVALRSIITQYAEDLGIPITIDEVALADAGKSSDDQVTLELPDLSFRSALKLMLEPLELTYVIKDEVMKITTKDGAKGAVMKVYPVGDLVVPIMQGGGMMGGMMGGMGGGMMGGMGGGMGGGMMGGMGGGMGGMGMGGGMGGMGMGGGGGMFAVPDDARKTSSAPVNSDRLSQAKDVLTQLEKANKEEVTSLEKKLYEIVAEELKLAQLDVNAKKMDQSRVRFQSIIDVLSESLRRGFPQPWMYEAMSLSMQACDYPGEEIRRVLLSAVDFSGNTVDSMKVASHLIKRGMKKEALLILEDVSRSSPMSAAPFEIGLPLALEIDDLEGIRWTCLGILKNGWPEEKAELVEKAQLAAKAAYMRLAKSKRLMEAEQFESQIKNAMVRDVVVRVSWTGDADIDLAVEEPSGSICSISNPRTVAGGVLTGDGSSAVKSKDGSYSETYVCPQGFAGKYRVFVQKAWGQVSSGKVTVDVLTDYGTTDESYNRKQIAVNEKDAMLEIEVKTGHRESSIVDAEIEQAELKRVAAGKSIVDQGRSVLAQQSTGGTRTSTPGQTMADFWMRQQLLAGGAQGLPFRGVVGYQPQLTTLPEGASMFTTAVISGDRRYVRVTPSPNFNQIIQVDTFNFISGAGTTQAGGGAGNQGGAAGGGGLGGGFGGGGGIQ